MDAFVYAAALYCQDCGNKIRADLTAEGKAPADPDNENDYDSDDFPKGPYGDGGGESDTPCHCDDCGTFLENPLTSEGEEYVKGRIAEHFESGSGTRTVLKEWASYYDIPFHPETGFATFNRFTISMPWEAVEDCSHSGACDSDVSHWAPKIADLNPGIDPEHVREELREYGAWDETELADDSTNWERIVWCAACNVKEECAQ